MMRDSIDDVEFAGWARPKGVVAVYLHGSQAHGTPRADSDVDLALLLDDRSRDWEVVEVIREEAARHLSRILKVPPQAMDVQILNGAPMAFQYRVIAARRLLWESHRSRRVEFEARLMSEYLDFRFYEAIHSKAMHQRLKEGTYGRRSRLR